MISVIDGIFLILLLLMTAIGVWRGSVKEMMLLFVVLFAVLVTMKFHGLVIQLFDLDDTMLVKIVVIAVLYIASTIFFMFLNSVLLNLIKPIRLGLFDRTVGGAIGFCKGAMIMFCFIAVVKIFYVSFYPYKENNKNLKDPNHRVPLWVAHSFSYNYFFLSFEEVVSDSLGEDNIDKIKSFGSKLVNSLDHKEKKASSSNIQKKNQISKVK
ncbi:CvpA family protein [Anaplasmataceae bacterium AB001_6]|nr:CvpA family protein [Anaplasmataceae bacterium AB001_6]